MVYNGTQDQIPAPLPGSLTVIGHSYTAGTTQLDSGVSNVFQESLVSRLQGLLKIHDDNVLHLGQGGAALTSHSNPVSGDAFPGWTAALTFIVPSNSANVDAANDKVWRYNAPALPGATIVVHGINDCFSQFNVTMNSFASVQATYVQRAYQAALRTVLSRIRASSLFCSSITAATGTTVGWDSTLAFSGGWSDNVAVGLNTGPAYKQSTTNNDTVTFTIPAECAGQTITFCFISQPGFLTYLTTSGGTINGTTGTTGVAMAVASNPVFTGFPGVDNYVLQMGTEQFLETAGHGTTSLTVTRAFNGTSAVTHATNDNVQMAANLVATFSGTAANATGTLTVGQIGIAGNFCCVSKRFATTAADAGKTIIATMSGIPASDTYSTFYFDSVWAEAPFPPPVVVTNVQHYPAAYNADQRLIAQISGFNTATQSVVNEFDSYVQLADVYIPFFNKNGVTTGNLNNTDVTTAIGFTANSASFTPTVGMVMSFGTSTPEHVQVTAISGTAPNWTLTCTRGYDSTTKTAWASGSVLASMEWMSRNDDVHLNGHGHAAFAGVIYNAYQQIPAPANISELGIRSSTSSQIQDKAQLGVKDKGWYSVLVSAASTAIPTTTTEYFLPIFVPKKSFLIGMGYVVTTGTTSTARFGIYTNGASREQPYRLLQDFGSWVMTGVAPYAAQKTGFYQLLNPGSYWLAVMVTAGGSTLQTVAAGALTSAASWATNIPASATYSPTTHYTKTSATAPFVDMAAGGANAPVAANGTVCPILWYQLRTCMSE